MKISSRTLLLLSSVGAAGAFSTASSRTPTSSSSTALNAEVPSTRRSWLQTSVLMGAAIASTSTPQAAFARTVTDASSLDPDLPNDAIKSYLQYRYSLQLAADYYIFDLQNMVADTGEINILSHVHVVNVEAVSFISPPTPPALAYILVSLCINLVFHLFFYSTFTQKYEQRNNR